MVIYRYGVAGAAIVATVWAAVAIGFFRFLGDKARLGWRRYPLFIGCFVSLALVLKYPGIVPTVPALCLGAGFSIQRLRTSPFISARPRRDTPLNL